MGSALRFQRSLPATNTVKANRSSLNMLVFCLNGDCGSAILEACFEVRSTQNLNF